MSDKITASELYEQQVDDSASESSSLVKLGWRSIADDPPPAGVLCVIYFPVCMHTLTGKTTGPITLAYWRGSGGWVHADNPTMVKFTPCYWQPFNLSR